MARRQQRAPARKADTKRPSHDGEAMAAPGQKRRRVTSATSMADDVEMSLDNTDGSGDGDMDVDNSSKETSLDHTDSNGADWEARVWAGAQLQALETAIEAAPSNAAIVHFGEFLRMRLVGAETEADGDVDGDGDGDGDGDSDDDMDMENSSSRDSRVLARRLAIIHRGMRPSHALPSASPPAPAPPTRTRTKSHSTPNSTQRFFARLSTPLTPAQLLQLQQLTTTLRQDVSTGSCFDLDFHVPNHNCTDDSEPLQFLLLDTLQLDSTSLRARVVQVLLGLFWFELGQTFKPGTGASLAHWDEGTWAKFYRVVVPAHRRADVTTPAGVDVTDVGVTASTSVDVSDVEEEAKDGLVVPLTLVKDTIQRYRIFGHRLHQLRTNLSPGCILLLIHGLDIDAVNVCYSWSTQHAAEFYERVKSAQELWGSGRDLDGLVASLGELFADKYGLIAAWEGVAGKKAGKKAVKKAGKKGGKKKMEGGLVEGELVEGRGSGMLRALAETEESGE
ncbi:hypothetical protein P153DRAFT_391184 [Dothidotthia symphoricarpi CBS 119687]|uniref:Uncharacterized protein n=1 Tax=Dothidotthia symphoricarpi CBS 119687 TaxID=1392245 RepID=A0A6A5ZYA9_9PLEO|nr:uncharacterized protein P153DRAFT_391184 [Dothidotthia symphoricarpi CBS 119687]KAF2123767.1 hypothetical protein P153DRAFT_391184 [Dothidotthia symphoricarpi CBS 119687]